jgi:toxin-antitoxin system PIN domain toxin
VIIPDVNVVVRALRADDAQHRELSGWLASAAQGAETLGLTQAVLSGVVRVSTHPKIFPDPTPTRVVIAQLGALVSHPGVELVDAGAAAWPVFSDLCVAVGATGALVADAAHAAAAIALDATWVTLDAKDFGRFPGLRWRTPFDDDDRVNP